MLYPVIGDPPLDAGAVHDNDNARVSSCGVTAVGASGAVDAATGVDDAVVDGRPVPTEFTADT